MKDATISTIIVSTSEGPAPLELGGAFQKAKTIYEVENSDDLKIAIEREFDVIILSQDLSKEVRDQLAATRAVKGLGIGSILLGLFVPASAIVSGILIAAGIGGSGLFNRKLKKYELFDFAGMSDIGLLYKSSKFHSSVKKATKKELERLKKIEEGKA